jgi:hypothetical protein
VPQIEERTSYPGPPAGKSPAQGLTDCGRSGDAAEARNFVVNIVYNRVDVRILLSYAIGGAGNLTAPIGSGGGVRREPHEPDRSAQIKPMGGNS